jgi:hypothetical protein
MYYSTLMCSSRYIAMMQDGWRTLIRYSSSNVLQYTYVFMLLHYNDAGWLEHINSI